MSEFGGRGRRRGEILAERGHDVIEEWAWPGCGGEWRRDVWGVFGEHGAAPPVISVFLSQSGLHD